MPSNVYQRLVKDEFDIAGLAAYGVYKKYKLDFIKQRQSATGKEIISDDDMNYFYSLQTDNMLELYKSYAVNTTNNFIDVSCAKLIKSELNKFQPSFWYGVLQSLTASILFIFSGYLIMKFSGIWDVILSKLF